MPRDYDDDKPKRSWREIDRNKDGSKHRQPDRPLMNQHKQARSDSASKVYKSKLDAFFEGDGNAPAHVKEKVATLQDSSTAGATRNKALKKIKEAGTSSAANKAVSNYLKNWDLPPDFDVLTQVLTCSDEDYLLAAMALLADMFADKRVPKHTQVLEQRLRRVQNLSDDPDLADKANELRRTLRLFS